MAKKKIKTIISVLVLIVILLVTIYIKNTIKTNLIREQEVYQGWLSDNCECLERERLKCRFEGFELKGDLCVNEKEKLYTSVVEACSKYNCSNEIVSWNNKTWEPKINN